MMAKAVEREDIDLTKAAAGMNGKPCISSHLKEQNLQSLVFKILCRESEVGAVSKTVVVGGRLLTFGDIIWCSCRKARLPQGRTDVRPVMR